MAKWSGRTGGWTWHGGVGGRARGDAASPDRPALRCCCARTRGGVGACFWRGVGVSLWSSGTPQAGTCHPTSRGTSRHSRSSGLSGLSMRGGRGEGGEKGEGGQSGRRVASRAVFSIFGAQHKCIPGLLPHHSLRLSYGNSLLTISLLARPSTLWTTSRGQPSVHKGEGPAPLSRAAPFMALRADEREELDACRRPLQLRIPLCPVVALHARVVRIHGLCGELCSEFAAGRKRGGQLTVDGSLRAASRSRLCLRREPAPACGTRRTAPSVPTRTERCVTHSRHVLVHVNGRRFALPSALCPLHPSSGPFSIAVVRPLTQA